MYAIVRYLNGVEQSVGEPKGWTEAYSEYEGIAAKVNATDKKGNYLHPEQRVSIRRV